MGRRKLAMKKIEDSASLLVTYTKRRDGIMKKANELSVLCGTDVGLVMFSPSAKLTKFSSKGRIEDIFLRYIGQHDDSQAPLENEELSQSLMHSKCEGEMLDMIAKKEALEKQLVELTQQQLEAKEKLGFYEPKVEKITSIHEAHIHEKYLNEAIQHVEKLKDELLGRDSASITPESAAQAGVSIMNTNFTTDETLISERKRNPSSHESHQTETSSPRRPASKHGYLDQLTHWILESGGPHY